MKSHFSLGSRAVIACAVSSAAAIMPQGCSAQFAADYATHSAYADGWQAGDNGGYGFTPWSFSLPYGGGGWTMNNSSAYNQLGTAWTLYNSGGSVVHAVRGFAGLQVGQTISVSFDNPAGIEFYRGLGVSLLSSGTERVALWRYAYPW